MYFEASSASWPLRLFLSLPLTCKPLLVEAFDAYSRRRSWSRELCAYRATNYLSELLAATCRMLRSDRIIPDPPRFAGPVVIDDDEDDNVVGVVEEDVVLEVAVVAVHAIVVRVVGVVVQKLLPQPPQA